MNVRNVNLSLAFDEHHFSALDVFDLCSSERGRVRFLLRKKNAMLEVIRFHLTVAMPLSSKHNCFYSSRDTRDREGGH